MKKLSTKTLLVIQGKKYEKRGNLRKIYIYIKYVLCGISTH